MLPTTRQEFIDYCYRSLGAPVIQINVDSLQAEDRLDEALEYMYERHFDFNQRALYLYTITQADITNRYFDTTAFGPALGAQTKTLPDSTTSVWPLASDIRSITKVYRPADISGDYMFDLRYQLTLFDFFGLYFNQGGMQAGPMANYMEAMSYIKLINDVFNYPCSYTYTKTTDRLFLDINWNKDIQAGTSLLVEAYVQIDPTQYPKVWQDRVFKKYYTALLKKQWAQNLMKFAGVPLPGGAQLNAGAIMADAVNELNQIEASLVKTQELPPDPLIG